MVALENFGFDLNLQCSDFKICSTLLRDFVISHACIRIVRKNCLLFSLTAFLCIQPQNQQAIPYPDVSCLKLQKLIPVQ